MPRLRRADCSAPGLRRVRRGRGFSYREEDGSLVADAETLERIAELAIPPAWQDVWICPFANGHIQATGIDAAGRKQYLYHQAWRESRDRRKFEEMLDFARALPRLRKRVIEDLGIRGFPRERVLAGAVRLLDLGFFRVGSDQYTAENETYGLSTLRRRHVHFERGAAIFDYKAKGAKRHVQELADPDVVKLLRGLDRRKGGGHELLAFRNGEAWVDVKASDINTYLKESAGGDFSAKDFRTWNATVLAAVGLAVRSAEDPPKTKAARKRIANAVVKDVARYLSNTPAVCRASYIDPRVFDKFDSGNLLRTSLRRVIADTGPDEFADREKIERAVMRLLD
ncbi:MAG TPA: DNA topoisomerase IB [Solirubrobacterales bacterium]|nr:DNA topoisomerase IB [Solirubrobacterales bacterium]